MREVSGSGPKRHVRKNLLLPDSAAHVSRETESNRSLGIHVQREEYLELGPRHLRLSVLLGDCSVQVSRETKLSGLLIEYVQRNGGPQVGRSGRC